MKFRIFVKNILLLTVIFTLFSLSGGLGTGAEINFRPSQIFISEPVELETASPDTIVEPLPFPFSDRPAYGQPLQRDTSGLFLDDPPILPGR
jgi:hypothetical protein